MVFVNRIKGIVHQLIFKRGKLKQVRDSNFSRLSKIIFKVKITFIIRWRFWL